MRWLQARGTDGGVVLGFVRGESALVLREAHAGVLTTLDLLEAALASRDPALLEQARYDPTWAPVRGHPRYRKLVRGSP